MITLSIGVFFWLSIGYITLKNKLSLTHYMDVAFVVIVMVFMSGINMATMLDCKTPETAILYTVIPWLFIFVPMLVVLFFFPNWKIPFSNTLGYFVVSFDKKNIDTLIQLLKNKEQHMMNVLCSPWVLLNKFTVEMLNQVPNINANVPDMDPVSTIPEPSPHVDFSQHKRGGGIDYLDSLNLNDIKNLQRLRDILKLKDFVSVWVWYMLTALITISTSYTLIMNNSCSI
jgi:hypothetical protein